MNKISPLLLLFAATCLIASARAHHSMDLSDATPIEVQGRILLSSWDGAHVVYRLQSMSERGEAVTWDVMGASPKILRGRGIATSQFPVGQTVTVRGRFDPRTRFIAPDYFITVGGERFEMGFYPPTMARGNVGVR